MTAPPSSAGPGGYLIAGGGTGGHVFPALALAGELSRRRPGASVVFVGTARGLETDLVPRAGYPLELVRARGIVGTSALSRASGAAQVPLGLLDSWRLLSRHRPRAVVGVGGYASGPVVATAWARRVPTVVHESNAVPGLTNRLLSRVATRVAVGTEAALSGLPGAEVVGNPVREAFFSVPALDGRPAARRLRLLVVGGSQGSAFLNRVVPPAVARLLAEGRDVDLVHQCGKARRGAGHDPEDLARAYAALGFPAGTAREFLNDMAEQVAAADLVVCRAGAMTVAELAAAGRPALYVPFAAATHGHQEANAREMERAGAAAVVTEAEAEAGELAPALAALLADPARLAAMGRAAREKARPGAAARLCDVVLAVERKGGAS